MKKIAVTTEIVTLPYKIALPVRGKKIDNNQFCKVTSPAILPLYLSSLPSMHQSIATEIKRTIDTFFDQAIISYLDVDFSKRFFNLIKDYQTAKYTFEQLFHIECVLFYLLKESRPELIPATNVIKENAVFMPEKKLEFYKSFDCMKIKISPLITSDDLINILKKFNFQNPAQTFRLDGNRQFELGGFLQLMSELKLKAPDLFSLIDYVEEPLKTYHDFSVAQKLAQVPLALDESFKHFYDNNQLHKLPHGYPLVLKPSLIGVSNCYRLLKGNLHFRFIISSSFEHPSIRQLYLFLAGLRPLETHGLSSASISLG